MVKHKRILLVFIFTAFVFSCRDDETEPILTVATIEAFDVKATKAKVGGAIQEKGRSPIMQRGICWINEYFGSAETPTVDDSVRVVNDNLDEFTVQLFNLYPATKHFVRAFAITSEGVTYGPTVMFTTLHGCPQNITWDSYRFDDDPSISTINGTWKLVSFEDCDEQEVTLKTEENSWGLDVILTFNDLEEPKIFSGNNTTNICGGEFGYNGSRQIYLKFGLATLADQPEWGNRFNYSLKKYASPFTFFPFIISETRLRIYYHGSIRSVTFERQ